MTVLGIAAALTAFLCASPFALLAWGILTDGRSQRARLEGLAWAFLVCSLAGVSVGFAVDCVLLNPERIAGAILAGTE